jgi:hypothetical protein
MKIYTADVKKCSICKQVQDISLFRINTSYFKRTGNMSRLSYCWYCEGVKDRARKSKNKKSYKLN